MAMVGGAICEITIHVQELGLKMQGGLYAKGGVYAGRYGTINWTGLDWNLILYCWVCIELLPGIIICLVLHSLHT